MGKPVARHTRCEIPEGLPCKVLAMTGCSLASEGGQEIVWMRPALVWRHSRLSDTEVTLEDADGKVWATAGRAQSIYEVSGEVSTDSKFNEGNSADNSLRFISSGADWGGVYISFKSTELGTGIEVNMENFAAIKFALKGSIDGLYLALSDVNNAGPGTFNLMEDYTPEDQSGWSVYTVPFAELTNLDKTKFSNLAFWAHNPGSDTYAGDILIDVEFVLTADY